MDDNNYMNNDNQSSGTPGQYRCLRSVFRNSKWDTYRATRNIYSQPQDTYSQPTDTYNPVCIPAEEIKNAYGQSSDQTGGSTDGYVNNPAVHMVMQIRGTYNQNPKPGYIQPESKCPGVHTTRTHMPQGPFNQSALRTDQYIASSQTDRVATIRPHTDRPA